MEKFSKAAFLHADDAGKAQLASELAAKLTERLTGTSAFHKDVLALVEELRALGHDLWGYDAWAALDESGDTEIWGPNYHNPTGPGIIVTFTQHDGVEVEWSQT